MSEVFSGKRWSIQRFVSGFANNAFLIVCNQTGKSVIIDTPANPCALIKAAHRTDVQAILITHGHRDHIDGFLEVSNEFDVPVGIGFADLDSLPGEINKYIELRTTRLIKAGNIRLHPLDTPGHTSGSTCFYLHNPIDDEVSHLFSGDTLFPGGPGKSVSHQAFKQIIESLEAQIYKLPDSSVVLPGHGDFTTIGTSKNEYALFSTTTINPDLYGDVTWTP